MDVSAVLRHPRRGYAHSRGTVDDKDNVVAASMLMLQLKRMSVPSIATSSSSRKRARRDRPVSESSSW
jgi:hypothetical protein